MGNFDHHICWKDSTARFKLSRGFLEHIRDSFLIQVRDGPKKRSAPEVLMLTNKEGLAGNVKVEDRLDYSGH